MKSKTDFVGTNNNFREHPSQNDSQSQSDSVSKVRKSSKTTIESISSEKIKPTIKQFEEIKQKVIIFSNKFTQNKKIEVDFDLNQPIASILESVDECKNLTRKGKNPIFKFIEDWSTFYSFIGSIKTQEKIAENANLYINQLSQAEKSLNIAKETIQITDFSIHELFSKLPYKFESMRLSFQESVSTGHIRTSFRNFENLYNFIDTNFTPIFKDSKSNRYFHCISCLQKIKESLKSLYNANKFIALLLTEFNQLNDAVQSILLQEQRNEFEQLDDHLSEGSLDENNTTDKDGYKAYFPLPELSDDNSSNDLQAPKPKLFTPNDQNTINFLRKPAIQTDSSEMYDSSSSSIEPKNEPILKTQSSFQDETILRLLRQSQQPKKRPPPPPYQPNQYRAQFKQNLLNSQRGSQKIPMSQSTGNINGHNNAFLSPTKSYCVRSPNIENNEQRPSQKPMNSKGISFSQSQKTLNNNLNLSPKVVNSPKKEENQRSEKVPNPSTKKSSSSNLDTNIKQSPKKEDERKAPQKGVNNQGQSPKQSKTFDDNINRVIKPSPKKEEDNKASTKVPKKSSTNHLDDSIKPSSKEEEQKVVNNTTKKSSSNNLDDSIKPSPMKEEQEVVNNTTKKSSSNNLDDSIKPSPMKAEQKVVNNTTKKSLTNNLDDSIKPSSKEEEEQEVVNQPTNKSSSDNLDINNESTSTEEEQKVVNQPMKQSSDLNLDSNITHKEENVTSEKDEHHKLPPKVTTKTTKKSSSINFDSSSSQPPQKEDELKASQTVVNKSPKQSQTFNDSINRGIKQNKEEENKTSQKVVDQQSSDNSDSNEVILNNDDTSDVHLSQNQKDSNSSQSSINHNILNDDDKNSSTKNDNQESIQSSNLHFSNKLDASSSQHKMDSEINQQQTSDNFDSDGDLNQISSSFNSSSQSRKSEKQNNLKQHPIANFDSSSVSNSKTKVRDNLSDYSFDNFHIQPNQSGYNKLQINNTSSSSSISKKPIPPQYKQPKTNANKHNQFHNHIDNSITKQKQKQMKIVDDDTISTTNESESSHILSEIIDLNLQLTTNSVTENDNLTDDSYSYASDAYTFIPEYYSNTSSYRSGFDYSNTENDESSSSSSVSHYSGRKRRHSHHKHAKKNQKNNKSSFRFHFTTQSETILANNKLRFQRFVLYEEEPEKSLVFCDYKPQNKEQNANETNKGLMNRIIGTNFTPLLEDLDFLDGSEINGDDARWLSAADIDSAAVPQDEVTPVLNDKVESAKETDPHDEALREVHKLFIDNLQEMIKDRKAKRKSRKSLNSSPKKKIAKNQSNEFVVQQSDLTNENTPNQQQNQTTPSLNRQEQFNLFSQTMPSNFLNQYQCNPLNQTTPIQPLNQQQPNSFNSTAPMRSLTQQEQSNMFSQTMPSNFFDQQQQNLFNQTAPFQSLNQQQPILSNESTLHQQQNNLPNQPFIPQTNSLSELSSSNPLHQMIKDNPILVQQALYLLANMSSIVNQQTPVQSSNQQSVPSQQSSLLQQPLTPTQQIQQSNPSNISQSLPCSPIQQPLFNTPQQSYNSTESTTPHSMDLQQQIQSPNAFNLTHNFSGQHSPFQFNSQQSPVASPLQQQTSFNQQSPIPLNSQQNLSDPQQLFNLLASQQQNEQPPKPPISKKVKPKKKFKNKKSKQKRKQDPLNIKDKIDQNQQPTEEQNPKLPKDNIDQSQINTSTQLPRNEKKPTISKDDPYDLDDIHINKVNDDGKHQEQDIKIDHENQEKENVDNKIDLEQELVQKVNKEQQESNYDYMQEEEAIYQQNEAEAIYEQQNEAGAIYEQQNEAEAIYEQQNEAEAIYEQQNEAEAIYEQNNEAKAIYEQNEAEAIYEQQNEAEAIYEQPQEYYDDYQQQEGNFDYPQGEEDIYEQPNEDYYDYQQDGNYEQPQEEWNNQQQNEIPQPNEENDYGDNQATIPLNDDYMGGSHMPANTTPFEHQQQSRNLNETDDFNDPKYFRRRNRSQYHPSNQFADLDDPIDVSDETVLVNPMAPKEESNDYALLDEDDIGDHDYGQLSE